MAYRSNFFHIEFPNFSTDGIIKVEVYAYNNHNCLILLTQIILFVSFTPLLDSTFLWLYYQTKGIFLLLKCYMDFK